MLYNEKGLCKAIKNAYRSRGYEVMPKSGILTILAQTWGISASVADIPLKATQEIIENVGYIPDNAMKVEAGARNQIMFQGAVDAHEALCQLPGPGRAIEMKKIPVIYGEKWQLYRTVAGEVIPFDIELLEIVDFKQVQPMSLVNTEADIPMGVWTLGDNSFFVCTPGRLSRDDMRRVYEIAEINWEDTDGGDADPGENMSLFEEDE